jgi:hypothetical protein
MTTENRPHEGSQPVSHPPGEGIPSHGHDTPDNRVLIDPIALAQGHEPDTVHARTILYVPLALVVTFAIAYAVVTAIVSGTRGAGVREPSNNPRAAVRGEEPINERVARISSSDAKAEVRQPRLEGAEQFKMDPGAAPNNQDPYYFRSRLPEEEGNSPQYHPEDLRPSSALGKKLGLQDYGEVNPAIGTLPGVPKGAVRIPVTEAMKLVVAGPGAKGAAGKYVLPISKNPVDLRTVQAPNAYANPQWANPDQDDEHAGHDHAGHDHNKTKGKANPDKAKGKSDDKGGHE